MARWVFKLRGLGTDPDVVRQFAFGDAATTRALDKYRNTGETNEQVLERLWIEFMDQKVVDAEYLIRKKAAEAAAVTGLTKAVPTVTSTET